MPRISLYRTYRFIDKDPIVDALRTVMQQEHLKASEIHEISGVAKQTVDNWMTGETRRPQNVTACAVTSSLGYARRDELRADGSVVIGFVKVRDLDPKEEAKKQADWLLRNAEQLQRLRARKKKKNGHANGTK